MLVLHIGTHKTGTSSLQAALARGTDALAGANVRYVEAGRGARFAHHQLAWAIRGRRKTPMSAWDGVRPELAEHQGAVNVMSSEGFWFEDPARVREALGDVGPVRVVAYLRRQDKFLQSLYKQTVASGRKVDFATWRKQLSRRGDYFSVLRAWGEAFGDGAITVRPYERDGKTVDVVRDFLGLLHVDAEAAAQDRKRGRRNPSPRRELLQFLLAFNQLSLDINYEKFFLSIVKHDKAYVRSADLLSPEECASVLAEYADGNRALSERYLGGAALFGGGAPDAAPEIWQPGSKEFFALTVDVLQSVVDLVRGGGEIARKKRKNAKPP